MNEFQETLDGSEFEKNISKDEWETPPEIFDPLNRVYCFTLDVCATKENAKCQEYFTKEDNGLIQSWHKHKVWMNCPYSDIESWLKKVHIEMRKHGNLYGDNGPEFVVALLPAWTDRNWFHNYVIHNAFNVTFLQGRVQFLLNGKRQGSPPFGSMLVEWR